MSVEDSAIAKSVGEQQEHDRTPADMALLQVIQKGKKISKHDVGYQGLERKPVSGEQNVNLI